MGLFQQKLCSHSRGKYTPGGAADTWESHQGLNERSLRSAAEASWQTSDLMTSTSFWRAQGFGKSGSSTLCSAPNRLPLCCQWDHLATVSTCPSIMGGLGLVIFFWRCRPPHVPRQLPPQRSQPQGWRGSEECKHNTPPLLRQYFHPPLVLNPSRQIKSRPLCLQSRRASCLTHVL